MPPWGPSTASKLPTLSPTPSNYVVHSFGRSSPRRAGRLSPRSEGGPVRRRARPRAASTSTSGAPLMLGTSEFRCCEAAPLVLLADAVNRRTPMRRRGAVGDEGRGRRCCDAMLQPRVSLLQRRVAAMGSSRQCCDGTESPVLRLALQRGRRRHYCKSSGGCCDGPAIVGMLRRSDDRRDATVTVDDLPGVATSGCCDNILSTAAAVSRRLSEYESARWREHRRLPDATSLLAGSI